MICDNCIHNAVCERAHFENHCGYKHTEADIINPELEDIKSEINANPQVYSDEYFVSVKFVNKILDNHISKLKGENK